MRNWEHNTRISEEVKDWKHSTMSVDQRERFYSFGLLNCLSSCVEVAVGRTNWMVEGKHICCRFFWRNRAKFCKSTSLFPMES